MAGKHIDGTDCPEGRQSIPRKLVPCCQEFLGHTLACYFDIRYEWWPRKRGWFIIIAESAGGGGIAMRFCPHCGKKLGGIKRTGRWLTV